VIDRRSSVRWLRRLSFAGPALAAAVLLFGSAEVRAGATIEVNETGPTKAGDNKCSLGEALDAAGSNAKVDACEAGEDTGVDTITVTVPGVIRAPRDGFVVDTDVEIRGSVSGTTIISGEDVAANKNAFQVNINDNLKDVTIADMVITGVTTGDYGVEILDESGSQSSTRYTVVLRNLHVHRNRGGMEYWAPEGAQQAPKSQRPGLVSVERTLIENNNHAVIDTSRSFGGIRMGACRSGKADRDLEIKNSVIRNNAHEEAARSGGGLYVLCGDVKVVNSTISGNEAEIGAGVLFSVNMERGRDSSAEYRLELVNSTVAGNRAGVGHGGVSAPRLPDIDGNKSTARTSLSFVHATIASNTGPGKIVNGVRVSDSNGVHVGDNGSLTVKNTVIAGNEGPQCSFGTRPGTIPTAQGSASSDSTCRLLRPKSGNRDNIEGVVAGLKRLAVNGNRGRIGPNRSMAPVETMSLSVDSGLFDAVSSDCPVGDAATDARGVSRPRGSACDIGAYEAHVVSGKVWEDVNADGRQNAGERTGLPGVTVGLVKAAGASDEEVEATTGADGVYRFPAAPAEWTVRVTDTKGVLTGHEATTPASRDARVSIDGDDATNADFGYAPLIKIGDLIWEDRDGDGDQDSGEPGIGGVGVKLTGGDGTVRTDTTKTDTTNKDGGYGFVVTAGRWTIAVTDPAGTLTGRQAPESASITRDVAVGGDNNLAFDFGYGPLASVGGVVWVDSDNDGVEDAGELGLARVTVSLLDSNGDPVRDGDEPVTATTSAEGAYTFPGLAPGSYQVRFTLPEGYRHTKTGSDSHVDPSTGLAKIRLAMGATKTVGAGVYRPTTPSAELSLVKSATAKTPVKAGDMISYSFIVTNSGNATLSRISVKDPKAGKVSCPGTVLAPEKMMTCKASYEASAADVKAGKVVNTATVRATAPDNTEVSKSDSVTFDLGKAPTFDLGKAPTSVGRLGGKDRYGTAAVISKETPGRADAVVYVATGADFPDALVAASASGGPILFVTKDSIPPATSAELKRSSPKKIIVLGGTGVVSTKVEAELKKQAPTARQAGPDRYHTAAGISAEHFQSGAAAAFIATGENYPDVLAGGPAAMKLGGPILLTRKDKLPSATISELKRLEPERIVVLGGVGAVSAAVEKALAGHTSGHVSRWAGADRYGTAAAISKETFTTASTVDVVYVATGLDFPDALAGGAAGGLTHGPVLLVAGANIPKATKDELTRMKPKQVFVLGGTAVVPESVEKALAAHIR